jgi:hypothetical protein
MKHPSFKALSTVKIKDLGTLKYNYKISTKKYNVLSFSLFKMYASYRTFADYIKNIDMLMTCDLIVKYNFTLRIYLDLNTFKDELFQEIYTKYEKSKTLQIIVFDCPNYKHPIDNNYHECTCGVFMRYLPIFAYPENDVHYCIVGDLDDSKQPLENYLWKIFESNIKLKFLFTNIKITVPAYNITPNNYFLGKTCIFRNKFPLYLLTSFFYTLWNKGSKYDFLREKIKEYNFRYTEDKFFYGCDEVFLEDVLLQFANKHKYKYAKNVLLSLRSTDALLRFMFKNILNKESNVTKEELATYKKMNSLVKKINKKFKDHNFKDFEEFISYFNRKTDKVRTNDAYLLYEYFHQIFFELYNKDTKNKLVKPRCFEAFKEANVFYDKTNNIEIIGGSD